MVLHHRINIGCPFGQSIVKNYTRQNLQVYTSNSLCLGREQFPKLQSLSSAFSNTKLEG